MDFTREPIIETVISSREGCRILIRNSKAPGQEEFVVDALEVVNIGTACFFRNRERPKPFLVPATDYEIIEVRDTRLGLKAASYESTFKAGPKKVVVREERTESAEKVEEAESSSSQQEGRPEKKRERKKSGRRRRSEEPAVQGQAAEVEEGKSEPSKPERTRSKRTDASQPAAQPAAEQPAAEQPVVEQPAAEQPVMEQPVVEQPVVEHPIAQQPPVDQLRIEETASEGSSKEKNGSPTLIAPPTTLIKDEIDRLRQNDQYKGAFYPQEEDEGSSEVESVREVEDEEAAVLSFRLHEEEQEPPTVAPEVIEPSDMYMATPEPDEDIPPTQTERSEATVVSPEES